MSSVFTSKVEIQIQKSYLHIYMDIKYLGLKFSAEIIISNSEFPSRFKLLGVDKIVVRLHEAPCARRGSAAWCEP